MIVKSRTRPAGQEPRTMGSKKQHRDEMVMHFTTLGGFTVKRGAEPRPIEKPARRVYSQAEVEANRAALAKRLEDERADEAGIHPTVPTDLDELMAWIKSRAKA